MPLILIERFGLERYNGHERIVTRTKQELRPSFVEAVQQSYVYKVGFEMY